MRQMNFNEPYYLAMALEKNHNLEKDIPILDLGCGTGKLAKLLSDYGFTNIYALDSSSNMLLAS